MTFARESLAESGWLDEARELLRASLRSRPPGSPLPSAAELAASARRDALAGVPDGVKSRILRAARERIVDEEAKARRGRAIGSENKGIKPEQADETSGTGRRSTKEA